ncbi:MAG: glycosyltransferase family 2 protein [Clostridiales bacterium]|nr:glycosyltransferase family 2 protein [Clostridiales bacterium]
MLSIVVPAYNEGEHIYENLRIISSELEKFTGDYEIIAVSDGSSDNTWDEVKRAVSDIPGVVDAGYAENQGKGGAIKSGVAASKGDIVGFIDADLDIPASLLGGFYKACTENPGCVAIGSKMHKDSKLEYPFARKVFSMGYFIMLKILFNMSCHDTQTGMKMYPGDVLRKAVKKQRVKGYAFDIELLALTTGRKAKIIEMPIEIHFTRGESFGRIKMSDVFKMFTDTLGIWWNLKIKKSYAKD